MNLELPHDRRSTQTAFANGLRQANAKLRIARLRIALLITALRSLQAAGVTIACVAVVIVVSRLGVVPAWLTICTAAIGVTSILLLFRIDLLQHTFARPDLQDTAERLDLATNGCNRISTAWELCGSAELTLFENEAINQGLTQLEQVKDAQPAVPDASVNYGWRWGLFPAACVLLFIALLVPKVSRTGAIDPVAQQVALIAPVAPTRMDRRTPADDARRDMPQQPVRTASQTAKSAGDQKFQNLVPKNASASAASDGMPPSSATSDAIEVPHEENAGAGQPSLKSERSHEMSLLANGLKNSQSKSAPKSGSSGQTQRPPRSGESGSKSSQSKGGESKGDKDPDSGAAGGGSGSPSQKPPKSSQGGDGAGGGDSGTPPPKGSSGSTMAGSNSTEAGGNGKSGGQSPPKKSRGVTPMMFGANEPDLFEGKPLPGPEVRTTSQVPPPKNPGQPAANAAVASRDGDEHPVERYSLPAAMRDIAGRYFQSFHNGPDQAIPIAANDPK
jgi:hypothetical protein